MGTLGQNLRHVRIDRRLLQKDVCAKAGLSQKYLSEIELDKVDPRVSVVQRLAEALGCSVNDLVGCTPRNGQPV